MMREATLYSLLIRSSLRRDRSLQTNQALEDPQMNRPSDISRYSPRMQGVTVEQASMRYHLQEACVTGLVELRNSTRLNSIQQSNNDPKNANCILTNEIPRLIVYLHN